MSARPRRSLVRAAHYPAPSGGINTTDVGSEMPTQDAIYTWNMVSAEYGQRVRLGWREYCIGLTGTAGNNEVRTMMPFAANTPANSKLFAVTSSGIWDVTTGTASQVKAFADAYHLSGGTAPRSGFGSFVVFSTPAGKWLIYCDEEEGMFLYGESNATWLRGFQAATEAWAANHVYAVGARIIATTTDAQLAGPVSGFGFYLGAGAVFTLTCTTAGTTGTTTPIDWWSAYYATTPTPAAVTGDVFNGIFITDGTVVWHLDNNNSSSVDARLNQSTTDDYFIDAANSGAGDNVARLGPSVDDGIIYGTALASGNPVDTGSAMSAAWANEHAGVGDPASFCFVMAWQSRLFFIEKNSTRAWYLDSGAVTGTLHSLDLGVRFKGGGNLRQICNWSYDGGSGLDTSLVAISDQGDVAIYQGTDPSSVSTFGIKGVWNVGSIPAGRRIATDYGGEVLLMASVGVIQLSRLVLSAGDPENTSVYATGKISNLFNRLMIQYGALNGWAMFVHPQENALMILVPKAAGSATEQLVMGFAKRAWSRFRDLPILSAAAWGGELYFGTVDGRVCRNVDYMDGITLAAPTVYTEIQWSTLGAFQNFGRMTQKQVQIMKPRQLGGAPSPSIQATARYDFNLTEPGLPAAAVGVAGWDFGVWDTALWDETEYVAAAPVQGAVGMGVHVAIAVRGSSSARTVLVGVDVVFEEGGLL